MTRPLLCLVGIFKNEAQNIRALLESAKPHVDRFAILDTGTTDGTQAIVREVMAGMPGEIYEEPFVDFATSRNRVLELACAFPGRAANGPEDYAKHIEESQFPIFTLMMSGDEVLHDGEKLRAFLETKREAIGEGAYHVEMRAQQQRWEYPRVLRVGAGWKYVNVVHEVPVSPEGVGTGPLIPGAHIFYNVGDVSRRARRIRDLDLPLLQKIVYDPELTDEEKAGAMYFLADTHTSIAAEIVQACGGKLPPGGEWISHQMAAMALYWRCGQLMERKESPCFDPDKARMAQFFYFHVAEKVGIYAPASEELVSRLEVLAKAAPRLPEVHYMLAQHAGPLDARKGLFFALRAAKIAKDVRENPRSHLPTDLRIEWSALIIAASCAMAMKNKTQARELAKQAIAAGAPAEAFKDFGI